jgi:hypothetical protein
MQSSWGRRVGLPVVLGILLAAAACNKEKSNNPLSQPPGGGGPGGMPGGGGGAPSPIGQAMNKIGKGPQSLNMLIGQELKSDSPPWDTIQPQTKEYAQLAGSLGNYDPPKGEKDSWLKFTESFAKSAEDLDKAAQAKNKDEALKASAALNNSCKDCHTAHRGMQGGGRGGWGRPGGGQGGPPGRQGGPPQ